MSNTEPVSSPEPLLEKEADLSKLLQSRPSAMLVGRGLQEYLAMFNLDLHRLPKDISILDVAGGVGSFTAEMRQQGYMNVCAADPVYGMPISELLTAAEGYLGDFDKKFKDPQKSFEEKDGTPPAWLVPNPMEQIDTPKKLLEVRQQSLALFAESFRQMGEEAYINSRLPELTSVSSKQDLILCANFLVAYTSNNIEGTVAAIAGMAEHLKDGGEILIYPGGKAFRSIQGELDQQLFARNLFLEIRPSAYNFVEGWDCYYKITKI